MKRATRTMRPLMRAAAPLVSLAVVLTVPGCGSGSAAAASPAAFCATLRHSRAHPGQIFAGLGLAPSYSSSTPTKAVLPAMVRIASLFDRLDQEAPAAVKPAMDTFTRLFNTLLSDFHHGTTVGQAEAYAQRHPPSVSGAAAAAAKHSVSHYLAASCHIHIA